MTESESSHGSEMHPDGLPGTDEPSGQSSRWASVGGRWMPLLRKNRVLWWIGAASVVALVGGLVVGRFVLPAPTAGEAPKPGLVTAPVGFGPLSSDVTLRGQATYADSVDVTVDTSSLPGLAVVTGQPPAVGAPLNILSIALEVAGRPLLVLPGSLPAYRTLRVGVSGPDVAEFKTAMRTVGIDAGDPADTTFDATAANAVTALYTKAGYSSPAPPDGAAAAVASAQNGVADAKLSLTSAQNALDRAQRGASAVQTREADNAIAAAQRAVGVAEAATPADPVQLADLRDALGLAQLQRQQLDSVDTSDQQAAVTAARTSLDQTNAELAVAQQNVLPTLPASEVLYLGDLPRRVDKVSAARGQVLTGVAMTVSGATLSLSGSVAQNDAKLLALGDGATVDLPDGTTTTAAVAAITPGADGAARWTITLTPGDLTPVQVEQLKVANVRVTIPVAATAGDVLSVPAVALTAGPGGDTRVQVVDGDPKDPDTSTHLVTVQTGLATAAGVEVIPLQGALHEGDLVVVGR